MIADPSKASALAVHLPISALVAAYQQSERDLRESCRLVGEAEERMELVFGSSDSFTYTVRGRHNRSIELDADAMVENLKRDTWRALVNRLEVRRLLSVTRAKELDQRLEHDDLPDITEAAIAEFVGFYHDHAPDMLKEAVAEVFAFLRPWRQTFKTNSKFEIGPRVILEGWVESGFSSGFQINYYREAEFRALDNVFSVLDGRGMIAKSYRGPLADAIGAEKSGVGKTDYFAFKCFKKRTLHLQFLRLDLLARLNQIAGGLNLKTDQAA